MKRLLVLLSVFMPIALMASVYNGKIEGTTIVSSVNVEKLTNSGFEFVSTVVVNPDGSFSFTDENTNTDIYSVNLVLNNGRKVPHYVVLMPNENVNVKYDQRLTISSVQGSKEMEFMYLYQLESIKMSESMKLLEQQFNAAQDDETRLAIQQKFNKEYMLYEINAKNLIVSHSELLSASLMAYSDFGRVADANLELFKLLYSKQISKNPNNALVKELSALVDNPIQVGKIAPEIELPGVDGNIIKLSSLKGKVVLIDFWASWCRPCRMENPNVVKAYNMFKDKGFTVYSVSLDSNVSSWKSAIEADKLAWQYHVSSLKQWSCPVAKAYGVKGIPYSVLIDKDGKIVATSLRGEELHKKLAELLK